jgi:hypothetical protein
MMAKRGQLAFTDPEALEERIEEYFQSRTRKRKIYPRDGDPYEEEYQVPPTMAGLALALDTTRQTLLAYGRGDEPRDPAFVPIIARAKMRIAEFAEEALYVREASNGAKFALEVNHGYGREDREGGTGEGFAVQVIPPAAGEQLKAILKWKPEGDDDE